MEVLANKISDKIAIQLNLDQEKRAVIAYGLIGLLQATTLIIIIIISGVISNSLYESLIVFASVSFMRKSTGGGHSKTMRGCNIVTVFTVTILAITSRYLLGNPMNNYVNFGTTLVVFLIGFIVFYRRVPIDSPNKPIVTVKKIKRLRKESFYKLTLLFLLTVGAIMLADTYERFFSIASSLRMALIWQAMSLTQMGISLLSNLDLMVNRILDKLKVN